MHIPYETITGRKADSRVAYKFRSKDEGGRESGAPYQGIRSDFSFVGDDENYQFMICPEFEDESKNVILSRKNQVSMEGTARMWVICPQSRPILYDRIIIGKNVILEKAADLQQIVKLLNY